jgi:myo-inositol 2-dehydrogenase/D-chiro-inositol 1-dehydrogenase
VGPGSRPGPTARHRMSDRVRLGIVGAGVAAQAIHLPVLQRRPDLFQVTAVCDPSYAAREAVADRCGVGASRRHDQVEELLDAAGLDALLVLSSGSHGAVCRLATSAGLPVFCEKPLAYTTAEADALDTPSAGIALGYMKVYDPAVRRAAELLDGRTARSVEVLVLHPPAGAQLAHLRVVGSDDVSPRRRAELEQEEQRLLELALGPALPAARDLYRWRILGSIVHELAVVRVLAGKPVQWERVDAWPMDNLASLALDGVLEGGCRLSIRWHFLAEYPAYREEVRVHDERGTVQITFPSPYLTSPTATLTVVDRDLGRPRVSHVTSAASPFEEELVAFHRLVTMSEPTAAGIAEGRADIVTCQRALRVYCEANQLPVGGEALAA